jgi:hypothetical protein
MNATGRPKTDKKTVTLRVREETDALIDRGAQIAQVNRSTFVEDAVLDKVKGMVSTNYGPPTYFLVCYNPATPQAATLKFDKYEDWWRLKENSVNGRIGLGDRCLVLSCGRFKGIMGSATVIRGPFSQEVSDYHGWAIDLRFHHLINPEEEQERCLSTEELVKDERWGRPENCPVHHVHRVQALDE